MKDKLDKNAALKLLTDKRRELEAVGLDRYPRRSDFSDEEVCAIKAFWGPWPRALEAAGLKEERDLDRAEKNRLKRIAAKRRMRDKNA